MEAMAKGLPLVLSGLVREKRIDGVAAMGGGRGTSVLRVGLEVLPLGMPKVLVTTMAGAGSKLLAGIKDTHLVDSVVDFSGLNDILRPVIAQAGAAVAAMAAVPVQAPSSRPRVAATMFGQTTPCVDACRKRLSREGYDLYPFHANGMGGPNMEALIDQGFFDAVLDITTTELLQEMVVPGTGSGSRVEAAGRRGIPQIVVPGALDSINVLAAHSEDFPQRRFCRHNAEVLLMRALPREEREIAKQLAEKLNRAKGKTVVVLPMGGFSRLSDTLPDPLADQALRETLRQELDPSVRLVESARKINDPAFAGELCDLLAELLPPEQAERK